MNVWKYKLIFPTNTLQQKIEITDLKPFLAAGNTSALIILGTAVRPLSFISALLTCAYHQFSVRCSTCLLMSLLVRRRELKVLPVRWNKACASLDAMFHSDDFNASVTRDEHTSVAVEVQSELLFILLSQCEKHSRRCSHLI